MNKSRHHYFRWTPRTARITLIYVAVIPMLCGYVAYNTDVSVPQLTATGHSPGASSKCSQRTGPVGFSRKAKGRHHLREIEGDGGAVGAACKLCTCDENRSIRDEMDRQYAWLKEEAPLGLGFIISSGSMWCLGILH